jgi:RND family efflux transporter MFP subunit
MMNPKGILLGGGIALISLSLWGCKGASSAPSASPPPVTVSRPQRLAFQEYFEITGNTVASRTVNLTARVEGYLRKIYFSDGSLVPAGTPLFLIEPEPYQAKVQLNEAQLINAQAEYERQQRLITQQATSRANLESWLAQRDAAKASTDLARINLAYTRVSAPFAGRIGRHLIDEGNLVGSGEATRLATLEQINPIYVYFNVSELDVLRVRAAMAAEHVSRLQGIQPVEAALQTDTDYRYHGTLDFIDTGVNASTGTLQARASFINADSKLLPGLFVKLRMAMGPPASALAVPDTAVGRDQAGSYVLMVNSQSRVVQQRVRTGGLSNGMRAITEGLAPQDRVIVDGLLNASPGSAVTALERTETQAESNPEP